MKRIVHLDLGDVTEKWLVDAADFTAVLDAFEWCDEDESDPNYDDHDSPLDRAAAAAGNVPVLCAHWGTQDLPETTHDLAELLREVIPADRDEVAGLVRQAWTVQCPACGEYVHESQCIDQYDAPTGGETICRRCYDEIREQNPHLDLPVVD